MTRVVFQNKEFGVGFPSISTLQNQGRQRGFHQGIDEDEYYIQTSCSGALQLSEAEGALEEMLFSGGTLNRNLLGASGVSRDRTV